MVVVAVLWTCPKVYYAFIAGVAVFFGTAALCPDDGG
jgi:hypothetical protein